MQRRLIVGTAGHIDHGKTKLVEAITGIDCDRWEEERRRGITIDIGFAHLERESFEIGFVDVPGHERFLHNALAGLGGIRIVLLVVAADEGIELQTLEHLEICSLLEIPRALVALTKADLVDDDLLELARMEVAELMESSPWPDAEIVTLSARTGDGVDEVVDHLLRLANELPEEDASREPARLPIDRAFQLKGLASIVTGTLVGGTIEPGDTLEILPRRDTVRVRSIQVHGRDRPAAHAGQRTALQITGVSLDDLERGQQLVEPGSLDPGASLLARYESLASSPVTVEGWTEVRFHHYSSEVLGRLRPLRGESLEPGATGVVEIRLAAPVTPVRGDRFVVRRPSPPATLGGGVVLDPRWRRRQGRDLERAVDRLSGSDDDAALQWADDSGLEGFDAAQLARRLGCRTVAAEDALRRLESEGRLLRLESGPSRPERWMAPHHFERLASRAERLLVDYLAKERLAPGIAKAEALRRLMPHLPQDVADLHLERLERSGVLLVEGDLLKIPGREAQLTTEESSLAKRLESAYRDAALQPPSPEQLARELGAKPQIVDGVVHHLARQGVLVKLGGGLLISRQALDAARDELVRSSLEDFTVADFRDHFGLTRKWAIPILEYFDAQRITHRLGDVRKVAARSRTDEDREDRGP